MARKQHPNSLANLQKGRQYEWQPGQSQNPGGRPSGITLGKQLAQELAPMIKSYKYQGLVERGRQIEPRDLWLALIARYEMALLDPQSSARDLGTIGRQIGEVVGVLGIQRQEHRHDHYAHIPDELKPLIAEKLALIQFQHEQKRLLLAEMDKPSEPTTLIAEIPDDSSRSV